MNTIKDGTGSGNLAKVDDKNRLYTYSVTEPTEQVEAENGLSFIIHKECHTAASTGGGLLYIKNNDSDYDMVITRIFIDSHTITSEDLICVQVFDATISNGTDISTTALINKNRGSSKTFDLTVKCSDSSSDITYTGGTQYHSYPIKTMTQYFRDMAGTIVIPAGKSILFGFKRVGGGSATDGQIISFSVNIIKYKKD
jgi:hypothetical protein